MNVDSYKRRLLEIAGRLEQRAKGERDAGRAQLPDSAGDAGDASVDDESESEDFTEADQDADVLQQVRGALERIEQAHSVDARWTVARLKRSVSKQFPGRRTA